MKPFGPMAFVRIAAALAALPFAACVTLGPDYEKPDAKLPAAYTQPAADSRPVLGGEVPDAWWSLFGDPALDRLVEEALAGNQDLAAAAARVEEARAFAGLARADQFPEITAQGGASRTKFSGEGGQFPLPPGIPLEFDSYRATANVSYEIDFWGRYRRASEAARADLLATEAGRLNVRLAVAAEVAAAYFDLLAFDSQLAVSRDTMGSRAESVRIQNLRFDAGTISELDLAQAQSELAGAEATIPVLERLIRQTENRLGVLLGRFGGTVPRAESLEVLAVPPVPVGLPSRLLERRPDVLAAEQRLIATNARIGVARAAYFPAISLTGYAGTESAELANLFAAGTNIWQLALGLVQPIFNGGRTRRQVEAATARQHLALAEYQKAVQSAFADVEDALVALSTSVAEREAIARRVEALTRSRRLSTLRYEGGESSYLEVLDANRGLFVAELEWARARAAEFAAAVRLFQALGGGWEETPSP